MRRFVFTATAGLLLSGTALAETVTPVNFPDFTLNGTTPVNFTETVNLAGDAYGLRIQADWLNVQSAWSSEFEAEITSPGGDTFSWMPVGGANSNAPFDFDVTRFLAYPFGTPGTGDWDFSFASNYPSGIADLANVQIDLIELETLEYSSETFHGGDTWFRPDGMGPNLFPQGPVNYHVQEFSVTETGLYDIYSESDGFDGVLYLYEEDFDPEAQFSNLVAFNDDGRIPLSTSEIIGQQLEAGKSYFLVTSSWEACEYGHFTNVIGGIGDIVPEPATATLLLLGGLLLRRTR